MEAERNFGLGARASGTRRRESAGWVNRAGEIPRGIRWSGGGVGMDGALLLKLWVRGLFSPSDRNRTVEKNRLGRSKYENGDVL